MIKRVQDRVLIVHLLCGIRQVRWQCFLEGFLTALLRCRSLRSLAVWLAWDLDFAGRSQVVGFVTVIRIISLSVMQYTQPRRWSSKCCNASTFDGEEQKRGRAPTVVDVPPNPRWKASQLAGQQLPAGLGDKHLQGAECATHTQTQWTMTE